VRLALAAVAILFAVTTVAGGAAAEAFYGKRDPGAVVSDEVAGQSLALLAAADPWGVLVGFIAFRLFDIVKPWPIGRLERLPRGWGILADDLAAGLAAGLVVGAARACGLVP
jgi:phosphatidylglycerophosphatase A